MSRRPAPRVVLLGSRDTLAGLGTAVRSKGLRFSRVVAIRQEGTSTPAVPERGSGRRPVDTLLVTSRHAVGPALRNWIRGQPRPPEVWAAGPGTAARLRAIGIGRVRRGVRLGAVGIVGAWGSRPRSVVHFRSDLAGERLARTLRAQGHDVREVVAYRVRSQVSEVRRHAEVVRNAGALVLTSPSVVETVRNALGPRSLRGIGGRIPAIVLGARTARAARSAGFRRVTVASDTAPQRFARVLVRVVNDGRA